MAAQKKPKTAESVERQITALEFQLAKMVSSGKDSKKLFAINGKIKKLKYELAELKKFEWLAR